MGSEREQVFGVRNFNMIHLDEQVGAERWGRKQERRELARPAQYSGKLRRNAPGLTGRRCSRLASKNSNCCACRILRRVIFAILAASAQFWRLTTCYGVSWRPFFGLAFRLSANTRPYCKPATPSRLSDTSDPRTQRRLVCVGDQPYSESYQSIRFADTLGIHLR